MRTIFLADGNTAALPTGTLVAIGEAAHARFPRLERITMYGSAKFLSAKSGEEWREVAAAGITRIHSGLETGDPETLEQIHKGVDPEGAARAFGHVMAAGIELSVYLMVGVAGRARVAVARHDPLPHPLLANLGHAEDRGQRVLRDRVDDRDDREAHDEADDERNGGEVTGTQQQAREALRQNVAMATGLHGRDLDRLCRVGRVEDADAAPPEDRRERVIGRGSLLGKVGQGRQRHDREDDDRPRQLDERPDELKQALANIKQENNIDTDEQFRGALQRQGIEYEKFVKQIEDNLMRQAIVLSEVDRAIVIDEGYEQYGVTAEIASVIADGAFYYLDAPVKRMGAMDVPVPFSPALEDLTVPTVEGVVETARELCGRV